MATQAAERDDLSCYAFILLLLVSLIAQAGRSSFFHVRLPNTHTESSQSHLPLPSGYFLGPYPDQPSIFPKYPYIVVFLHTKLTPIDAALNSLHPMYYTLPLFLPDLGRYTTVKNSAVCL